MNKLLTISLMIFSFSSFAHNSSEMNEADRLIQESTNNNKKDELTKRLERLFDKEEMSLAESKVIFSRYDNGYISGASVIMNDRVCKLIPGYRNKFQFRSNFIIRVPDFSKDELYCTVLIK